MAMRLTVALLLMSLATACGTPRAILLDTGQDAPRKHYVPGGDESLRVSESDFQDSLSTLVLALPLALRSPERGWLVRTSFPPQHDADAQVRRLLRKSFGGVCRPGQLKENCLSLLDDMMGLRPTDKLALALAESFSPMRASIAEAVKDTLAPQLFYAVALTGVVTWMALAANPEPVFTKSLAIVSAVMLIYLGVDSFLELVKASSELKRATDRANTYEELKEAGERFGRSVGPEVGRVIVLAVTVAVSRGMVSSSSGLASHLSLLPRFPEATAVGAAQLNIRLAAVEQVSAVAVVEGNLVISLAPIAVAMATSGGTSGSSLSGSSGGTGFNSFKAFKDAMGPAGPNKNWHHIVEQTPGNVQRFGPKSIHNTDNVIAIDEGIHRRISAYYSSKDTFTNGQTVREWLRGQSYQAQREFGLKTLRDYGILP